jgi:hypothetical protein
MKKKIYVPVKEESITEPVDKSPVSHVVSIGADTLENLAKKAIAFLEESGYAVRRRDLPVLHKKETPSQFYKRIGISHNTFCRKIRDPRCPTDFEMHAPTGRRTVWLRASPRLEEFMLEFKAVDNSGANGAR